MVKYVTTEITFCEVPDKICRTFSISNCGGSCPGCHSPYLRDDNGHELTEDILFSFFEKDKMYVDCYVFLGEGNDIEGIKRLFGACKTAGFDVCLYTGKPIFDINNGFFGILDYLKVGPFIEELGGLDKKTTNQKFYHVIYNDKGYELIDMTWKFLPENSRVLSKIYV